MQNYDGENLPRKFSHIIPKTIDATSCRYQSTVQDFIATILDKEVKDLYLIPNEPALDMSQEKQMSFDVSVVFENNERADLEMIW